MPGKRMPRWWAECLRLIGAVPELIHQLEQQWIRCRCVRGKVRCETCQVTQGLLERLGAGVKRGG